MPCLLSGIDCIAGWDAFCLLGLLVAEGDRDGDSSAGAGNGWFCEPSEPRFLKSGVNAPQSGSYGLRGLRPDRKRVFNRVCAIFDVFLLIAKRKRLIFHSYDFQGKWILPFHSIPLGVTTMAICEGSHFGSRSPGWAWQFLQPVHRTLRLSVRVTFTSRMDWVKRILTLGFILGLRIGGRTTESHLPEPLRWGR